LDLFNNIIYGFGVALSLQNLLYSLIGVLTGTLIGVLPGVGPLVTIAMLLPITFKLAPIPSLIMLAGIFYGAQYGGSTTSILMNLPGEASSVMTCVDGYQMAQQGRAGPALAIAAFGSFFAGCVGTLLIGVAGPMLAELAIKFTAPDYFSLMLLALVAAAVLAQGDMIRSLSMLVAGLLLGIVGSDVNTGLLRFTFGLDDLADGVGFTIIGVALFAMPEIIKNLEGTLQGEVYTGKITGLMPTLADMKATALPILRGTTIGSFFGILPGIGPITSTFVSYVVEKKLSKDPTRFGRGAIEGVAAPEAANNAAAQCSFIPMLTLGLPSNPVMALFLGALMIHGISPGPRVMVQNAALFWGLIASMWIGNLMLLVINLPLIGIWVKMLKVPYRWMFPSILMFCAVGNYSINNSSVEMYITAVMGILGYIFIKLDCEPAPMIMGFVLGPMMEENLRRSMLLSQGDLTVFITRPISLGFILATVLLLIFMIVAPVIRKRRQQTDNAPME
jgi:putative tricarboxylic transport membrane protein